MISFFRTYQNIASHDAGSRDTLFSPGLRFGTRTRHAMRGPETETPLKRRTETPLRQETENPLRLCRLRDGGSPFRELEG